MTNTTLAQIGQQMYQEALANPGQRIEHKLERGLILIMLHRAPVKMQLSLVRHGTWPSLNEVDTIKRHFDCIPNYAQIQQEKQRGYHVIRLVWDDASQLSLLPADSSSPAGEAGRGVGEGDAYHD